MTEEIIKKLGKKMKDEELIRAYTISIFMIAFLEEYGKLERTGVFAKVYNRILKKNSVFQEQIDEFRIGKRKKISHKAKLFSIAINCSTSAWEVGIKESKKLTISVGTSIANLFRLNEDVFTKIYGLGSEDFVKIHRQSQAGVTFNSCKMANTLTRNAVSIIEEKYTIRTENH